MLSGDIFSHSIIPYFRGNYSEINNLLSPITEKEYKEYKYIIRTIKSSFSFSNWYQNFYNNNMNYIIAVNNSILFNDIDIDYLEGLYDMYKIHRINMIYEKIFISNRVFL